MWLVQGHSGAGAFVDLEKAFDRVTREVIWWALRYLGVNEWVVLVIRKMYEDATAKVKLNGRASNAFNVKVEAHQGSVLNPLLFIIVLEALSREIQGRFAYGIVSCRRSRFDGRIVGIVDRKVEEVEKKDGSKVSQTECYSKARTMLIIQLLLKLSYFISNFPGIGFDRSEVTEDQ